YTKIVRAGWFCVRISAHGVTSLKWFWDTLFSRLRLLFQLLSDFSDRVLGWADYHVAQARLQEAQWYLAALNGGELPPEASGAKLAQLEAARQELEDAQQALADTELHAPVAGTITALNLAVGQRVTNTANVVTIADTDHPYVDVYLDEIDWDKIAPGYDAEVTFDAVEDKTYTGKVVRLDPALVNESGTMLVHGLVALDTNQNGLRLPIGAAAAVDVIGGKAEGVLLVPVEALREISLGQYAVFVLENGEPTLRMVEVGLKDMFYAEIKSGLEAGEIVTTGLVETEK
ncbi:MAG TPA: efflux RND transporter periplasmic adaptor subunit, partial [Chloroflexi bacterium]|nr:efflux RND transporter periplasmic adaptor subunit [Chloroflexota bacterium]